MLEKKVNSHFREQRRFERKTVKIGAKAVIANSDATIDCTILDLSEEGAKLKLIGIDVISARFKLFVPNIDHIYDCEVVWRNRGFLGVKFTNNGTF